MTKTHPSDARLEPGHATAPSREEGDYRGIALANRDRLAATTLEFMSDAVLIVDDSGTIVAINPAFQRLFGLRWSQVVGEPFASAMIARPEFTEFTDTLLEAILQPDKAITRDVVVTPEGDRRYLSVRTSVLAPREDDDVHGLVAVVSDETDRVRFLRSQTELIGLLLTLIVSFALSLIGTAFIVANTSIEDLGAESIEWITVSWSYMLALVVPSLIYILYSGIPLASVGVTFANWRRAIAESAVVFVILLAGLMGVAFVFAPSASLGPFDLALTFGAGFGIPEALYLVHSFLQEFIARGVMQTSIRRILYARHPFWAILIAGIVFSSMHAAWGLPIVFFTFVSSFVFGWLFDRHKTLIGIWLLHFALGSAIFVLQVH